MLQVPLSDDAWQKVSHLFDYAVTNRPGRPRRHPRAILDAILWVHVNREKWHRLPATYPPGQTCYLKWLEWNRDGIMERAFKELEAQSVSSANIGSNQSTVPASRTPRESVR
jgi:transposase